MALPIYVFSINGKKAAVGFEGPLGTPIKL